MNTHVVGGRSNEDGGRISGGLDNGGNVVKGPRPKTVGKIGECNKTSIMRGAHPDNTDIDNDGANY